MKDRIRYYLRLALATTVLLWSFGAVVGTCAATTGCASGTTQALVMRDATVSANATAISLETTQSLLLVFYQAEQEIAITQAQNAGETKDQAKARIAKIRTAWVPVWDACSKARMAYQVLVALLSTVAPSKEAIQGAVTEQANRMRAVMDQLSLARTRAQQVTQ